MRSAGEPYRIQKSGSELVDGVQIRFFRLRAEELFHDLAVLQEQHGREAVDAEFRGEHGLEVNVDVADYKRQRADRIADKAENWIKKVRETGEPMRIDLNAADRRVVHKLAEDYSDITTHSEGEGRERQLIIEKIKTEE